MANFSDAFNITVKSEGGYVNNPNDKGGETYMGITRKNYPNLKMWKFIDQYKVDNRGMILNNILSSKKSILDEVRSIYRTNYWNKLKLDKVKKQRVANQFFDIAVNNGITAAIKTMQRIAGMKETGKISNELINYYG